MLTDFRPAAHNSDVAQSIPYRLDGIDGHMLQLAEGATTPVRLACPAHGPHRVSLGFRGASGIRVRFAGESSFRWVETSVQWDSTQGSGEELCWRTVDLDGRDLEFLPQPMVRRSDH